MPPVSGEHPQLFSLEQIRAAFWAHFHGAGELWFSYFGSDEECEAITQEHFDQFVLALKSIPPAPTAEPNADGERPQPSTWTGQMSGFAPTGQP